MSLFRGFMVRSAGTAVVVAAVAAACCARAARAGEAQERQAKPTVTAPEEPRVSARELIRRLGAENFRDREKAHRDLLDLGSAALDQLAKALDSDDAEVRGRAETILAAIHKQILADNNKAIQKALLWKLAMPGGLTACPAVCGQIVLVIQRQGSLCALDARTGKEKWRFSGVHKRHQAGAGASAANGKVFVLDKQGGLRALDAASGQEKWQHGPSGGLGLPACDGGTVYVGAGGNDLRALDADTGKVRWKTDVGAAVRGRPAPTAEAVFCASADQKLHALEAKTGRIQWSKTCKLPASPPDAAWRYLAARGPALFVRTAEALFALDAQTGKDLWRFGVAWEPFGLRWGQVQAVVNAGRVRAGALDPTMTNSGGEAAAVQAGDGAVYLAAGEKVLSVAAETGKQLWEYRPPLKSSVGGGKIVLGGGVQVALVVGGQAQILTRSFAASGPITPPAAADGRVYFGTPEGLYALDTSAQQLVWKFVTGLPVEVRPAVANGVVYFSTTADRFIQMQGQMNVRKGGKAKQEAPAVYAVKVGGRPARPR